MTEAEKIKKIKQIYQDFLVELTSLKKQASKRNQKHIKAIEKKKINQILDKIHNEL